MSGPAEKVLVPEELLVLLLVQRWGFADICSSGSLLLGLATSKVSKNYILLKLV